MNDKDIIEYLKNTPSILSGLQISANLNVLAKMMILKGWITESEYEEAVNESINKLAEEVVNKMTKEERQNIETTVKLADLFDTNFKNKER